MTWSLTPGILSFRIYSCCRHVYFSCQGAIKTHFVQNPEHLSGLWLCQPPFSFKNSLLLALQSSMFWKNHTVPTLVSNMLKLQKIACSQVTPQTTEAHYFLYCMFPTYTHHCLEGFLLNIQKVRREKQIRNSKFSYFCSYKSSQMMHRK